MKTSASVRLLWHVQYSRLMDEYRWIGSHDDWAFGSRELLQSSTIDIMNSPFSCHTASQPWFFRFKLCNELDSISPGSLRLSLRLQRKNSSDTFVAYSIFLSESCRRQRRCSLHCFSSTTYPFYSRSRINVESIACRSCVSLPTDMNDMKFSMEGDSGDNKTHVFSARSQKSSLPPKKIHKHNMLSRTIQRSSPLKNSR